MPEGGDLTKISRRKAISRAAATGAIVAVGAVAGLGDILLAPLLAEE